MRKRHTVAGGGDVALNVLEWGRPDGPPILFVHGWSQTYMSWLKQLESPLAERFRLVAFDLRGHGLSAAPAAQSAYTDSALWAADVAAVIDALGLERVVLVGWSYGGLVITDYLRAYGAGAVAGVNLVGATVRLDEAALGPLIGPGFYDIFARAVGDDLEAGIDAMREFVERCFAQKLSRADYERTLCWNMTVRPDVRAALAAREVDNLDVLAALACPLLLSHGRRDVVVLPAMSERVLAACAHATASWYDDAGHGPFIEDAARFNAELADFVQLAHATTARG
ncbi:MAG: alpha/beta hydrolase [Gammaproteobacteria bacterium]